MDCGCALAGVLLMYVLAPDMAVGVGLDGVDERRDSL